MTYCGKGCSGNSVPHSYCIKNFYTSDIMDYDATTRPEIEDGEVYFRFGQSTLNASVLVTKTTVTNESLTSRLLEGPTKATELDYVGRVAKHWKTTLINNTAKQLSKLKSFVTPDLAVLRQIVHPEYPATGSFSPYDFKHPDGSRKLTFLGIYTRVVSELLIDQSDPFYHNRWSSLRIAVAFNSVWATKILPVGVYFYFMEHGIPISKHWTTFSSSS
ncbi:hypothetical protein BDQ12DRAFT_713339 [Crucibulum laeve]|uniref:Uncharacterized protein n=1 Tax=Crucibulum laeve TaxID=68775 RepID=A0A5C3LYQ0_9AGAR|nr:hypothetical protein BDQ12DRAFT_713339 [Crucibulum laeve]